VKRDFALYITGTNTRISLIYQYLPAHRLSLTIGNRFAMNQGPDSVAE
jgi:hypothetical protein